MDRHDSADPSMRETHFEYVYRDVPLGRISDPHNDRAWIESTVTLPVEP